MSDIYDRLVLQQSALQTVPVYGANVMLDQPPAGDDPQEGIFLDPTLEIESDSDRSTITALWTAVVIATPEAILETALDAQDAMIDALNTPTCPLYSISRVSLAPRAPQAQVVHISVTTVFTHQDS